MSLVIRSSRTGKKGERKFRIVVTERRSRRDGRSIENLGWYEKNGNKEINRERVNYWVSKGARLSPAIHKLINI